MRLLLDTSIFLRLASDPDHIPKKVRAQVQNAELRALSVASAWEIAIKASIGKLSLPSHAEPWIRSRAARMLVEIAPLRFEHVTQVETLPFHHRDPFDRLLVAQAVLDDYVLVTEDRQLKKYALRLLPAW